MGGWPASTLLLKVAVIVAATLVIYWPSLQGDWLWDDDELISQNPLLQNPAGLWQIWFTPRVMVDYQPVEVSALWLEWQLWGGQPLGYHLVSVVLHVAGALLVWRLLSRLGLRLAWLGGLIFAIHPLMVESVAWMAEQKNTISLIPFLLAMNAWVDFDEQRRERDYLLALGGFAIAMLCKSTMIMFPVVILLYAWWKRGRLGWADLKSSVPFFAVSLALGVVTIWFLRNHAFVHDTAPIGGPLSRLAVAGLILVFYFVKCLVPLGLSTVYPQWPVNPPAPVQFLPWLAVVGIIAVLWWKRRSWGRAAILGLGFFTIMLLPFLGFTSASYMEFTWAMDHMLYLPIIGLIGLFVAVLGDIGGRLAPSARAMAGGAVLVLMALSIWQSRGYDSLYVNREMLWTHVVAQNPEAFIAYHNLGKVFESQSRLADAVEEYELALRINPGYANSHNNLGNILLKLGRIDEAVAQFQQGLVNSEHPAATHDGLGNAYLQANRVPEAVAEYAEAVRLEPTLATSHNNLGNALARSGRVSEATAEYQQAVRIRPTYAEAYYNLGNVLAQAGRFDDAMVEYQHALRVNPGLIEAHNNLAAALCHQGRLDEAKAECRQMLEIDPGYAPAQSLLAKIDAAMPKK